MGIGGSGDVDTTVEAAGKPPLGLPTLFAKGLIPVVPVAGVLPKPGVDAKDLFESFAACPCMVVGRDSDPSCSVVSALLLDAAFGMDDDEDDSDVSDE